MSPPFPPSSVPLHMRYSRESYFEPKFVSIGPFNYNKLKKEKVMTKAKEKCISYFANKLSASTSNPVNDFFEGINVAEVKDRIDRWYGKSFDLPDNEFYEMLVRDSCFIIRIILSLSGEGSMFFPGVDIKTIRFDLLLLENQIPFFFLKKVYNYLGEHNMLPGQSQSQSQQNQQSSPQQSQIQTQIQSPQSSSQQIIPEFLEVLRPFIWLDMPWEFNENGMSSEPEHLLDLYWKCCLPELVPEKPNDSSSKPESLIDIISTRTNAPKRIRNACVLYKRAGVTFEKREHENGFGVTFRKGVLQLPHLLLDLNQATLLVNLVAFEEFKLSNEKILTSYVLLLDGLITSGKDVELLQQHGVITEKLGSSKKASTFFNDIGNICTVDYDNHYCQDRFNDLNNHCDNLWNRHCASLHHGYFKTPWKAMSLFAAIMLLIFSGLGTVYTIVKYY